MLRYSLYVQPYDDESSAKKYFKLKILPINVA